MQSCLLALILSIAAVGGCGGGGGGSSSPGVSSAPPPSAPPPPSTPPPPTGGTQFTKMLVDALHPSAEFHRLLVVKLATEINAKYGTTVSTTPP